MNRVCFHLGMCFCILLKTLRANSVVVYDKQTKRPTCPSICYCLINKGSSEVHCDQGGLTDRSLNILLKEVPVTTVRLFIDGGRRRNRFRITTAFKRFGSLQELHLTHCGLTSLGARTFARLDSLRLLNLAHNRLSYITPATFESTEHLETLVLDSNLLGGSQRLPTGAFSNLKRLGSLSLADNNLTHFPSSFLGGVGSLRTLRLDGNPLSARQLVGMLADVPTLTELSLNGCRLGALPADVFQTASGIKRLHLADNDLGLIPIKPLSQLKHLTQLDLSGNGIVYVQPYAFFWAPQLQRLSLARNSLGETYVINNTYSRYGLQPLSCANLTLTSLDLSYNAFTVFDRDVLGFAKDTLHTLDLSGNPLRQISPRHTLGIPLTELHIADTQLVQLPFSLPQEYANLRLLNISRNRISHISEQAINQLSQRLESLDISHNAFRQFPEYAAYRLRPRLLSLRLHGNPWQCSCRITALRKLMFELLQRLPNGDTLTNRRRLQYDRVLCDRPQMLAGVQLLSMGRRLDCASWFEAIASTLTRRSEVGILVGIVLSVVAISFLVLFVCYKKNWRHSGAYETRESSRMSAASSRSTHLWCSTIGSVPPSTPPQDDNENDLYQFTL